MLPWYPVPREQNRQNAPMVPGTEGAFPPKKQKKIMTEKMIALNERRSKEQTRAFVQERPLATYDAVTREERLSQLAVRINRSDNEEEQRRLKGLLPFRCPHYRQFRDNYRDRAHIVAESFTWQTCIDIDDPAMVAMADAKSDELDREEGGRWQGLLLHKEYSIRRKLHIDLRLPVGMTVPEAQRAYCEALGVACDTSCFTPERFIYLSPADFELYRSDGWYAELPAEEVALRRKAYTDRGLSIDGRTEDGAFFDENAPSVPGTGGAKQENAPSVPGTKGAFKGIPYSSIISEYWQRTGGEPAEGERNKRLHQLAANLRAICDNSEQWLLAVMPRYGLAEQEMRSIVHSACKEPTKGSRIMDQIVLALGGSVYVDDDEASAVAPAATASCQVNVKDLPVGLRESLAGVPPSMYMPVLCAVMPIAAAYADQVEAMYCDGDVQRLGLMSIIRGEQASGKSVCKRAVDVWMRQLMEEDAIARKREEEWKERKKGRKANEKAPEDPKVLIRTVPVTVSCSTLLRRLKNAHDHCLYSFGEELDTLRKTNGAGSWSSKYDIYRVSFDHGRWGQDYNSDQAESGNVEVAYNWTMLGTNGAVRKCFKGDNIENGLSSRILIAEMPDSSFAKMPKYGRRSADDEARIQEAVSRLRAAVGMIDTPRLRKVIDQWVEEKRVEAAKNIDHVMDTYRRRAAVIGFRCGVVFHLLTGKEHETKKCLQFALLMADYCLQQQMNAFGESLANQYVEARSECQRYGCNHSVFDQLAPTFTMSDLRALKRDFCGETSLRKIISRWCHDMWIEKVDSSHWRKLPQS